MPVYRMIFIGDLADMDLNENTQNAERAYSLINGRSYGGEADPLHDAIVDVSMNDTNSDGVIALNNAPGAQETVSYTLDGTTYNLEVDSTIRVRNVEITRLQPDGTTDTVTTTLRVFQDTSGNTFLMPPPLSGGEAGEVAGVTTYPIVSVVFPTGQSNYVTQYTHVYTDRYDVAGFVPCFTAGTLIRTDAGDRAAETLQPGDRIWTRDHGFQPIKWCGIRRITASDLVAHEAWRPIRISAGALGKGMPDRDLIVSPQHRVLVRSAIAIRMFGCAEILVAAKRLTELPGIEIDDSCEAVSYVHLMFADHEIVLSNGAETESLYLGKMAVAALGQQAVDEILALFPALENDDAPPSARLIPAGRRVDRLVDRHIRNDHPLVS